MRLYCCWSIWLCVAISPAADAQTLLRWKLTEGEQFVVRTEQRTESTVAFAGKAAKSKILMELDILWKVEKADDTRCTVRQTIQRLTASLATATGAAEYDSSAKSRAVGLTKQLSDALQPLVGAQFETEMNDCGEVLSVKPASAGAEALFQSALPDADGGAKSAVQQVIAQSILQLPEQEVNAGGNWQATREMAGPAGPLRQEMTYTLAKLIERDGADACQIEWQAKLTPRSATETPGGSAQTAIRIKDHQQSGTVWFAPEQGRMIESEQTQKLVTERAYRDTTITVTLESTQKSTVRAEG